MKDLSLVKRIKLTLYYHRLLDLHKKVAQPTLNDI